jgi:hypothetical protein
LTRSLPLLACALFLVVAAPAAAQSANPRAEAEALFREGRRAAGAGDFAAACARFAESQRLDPSTGTLLNLGDCEEHRGHLSAARNYFQTALTQLGASDPRSPRARERLTAIEARMPRLAIVLPPSAPTGTAVVRDGVPVPSATLGDETPVDPGEHVIVTSAPGHLDRSQTVVLLEGQGRRVVAETGAATEREPADAEPRPLAPEAPSPIAAHGASGRRTGGWIAGGAGLAGLALAAVSGAVLLDEKGTVSRHCPRPDACDGEGAAAASANKVWLPVNAAAWIVGAAGVGAGAFLILTSGPDAPRTAIAVAPCEGGARLEARTAF